ncbi:mitochondrial 50S ribosomal protein L28-like protein, partial [Punctularia strigosozonata HHB-11173 SS5]|uniref:mitochondrial 50S ribosomal protein L28-like protein n=1 Tax=Punctularia strigosozonata (strain HHB-11173) TaxID=741275 RepID=UPI0004417D44
IVSTPFKRAQTGLYHGVMKQSGNNVPFSKGKTRRTWLPNVHNKTFFSETFQKNVRVKVSMKALKTIKKNGGIDNYLRKTKPSLLGDEGMRLRISLEEAAKKRRTE